MIEALKTKELFAYKPKARNKLNLKEVSFYGFIWRFVKDELGKVDFLRRMTERRVNFLNYRSGWQVHVLLIKFLKKWRVMILFGKNIHTIKQTLFTFLLKADFQTSLCCV